MRRSRTWPGIAGIVVGVGVTVLSCGEVRVHYEDGTQPWSQHLSRDLQEWGYFELVTQDLTDWLILPEHIDVWFAECGVANAFYNPEERQVLLSYELINALSEQYAPYAQSEEQLTAAVWQTVMFTLYHELGHALIDVLDLSITGREEDVVDQLAAYILINGGEAGRDAALQGASWFFLQGQAARAGLPFWDTHLLDAQRYYNILCWSTVATLSRTLT